MKTKRPIWYLTIIEACPVCGRESKYKTAKYTKRPANIMKRYDYQQTYCGCQEGFHGIF